MTEYSGHRRDRPGGGWPQGIRQWQDMVGLCRLQLPLRGCGSAEWPCHMGEHRGEQRGRKSGVGSLQDHGGRRNRGLVEEMESEWPERTSTALLQKWRWGWLLVPQTASGGGR